MANGDTIKQVKELLESPNPKITAKAAQLMTLTLLADLYEKYQVDHEKLQVLWPAYLIGRWGILIVAGLGLADLVTRFLALIGK